MSIDEQQSGEAVREMVMHWLRRACPDGPQWDDPSFDALATVPLELRFVHIHDVVEGEIGNGGWAQLLWNCGPHWRTLVDVAEAGYRLIGATAYAEAIGPLRRCCAHCEDDCRVSRARAEAERNWLIEGYPMFGAFLDRARAYDAGRWERVFYDEDAYKARLIWLARNEGRIRSLIGAVN